MGKKSNRLQAIHQILTNEQIGSQEQLMSRLSQLGFNTTQSTLSRDFKALGVSKVPNGKDGYLYLLTKQVVEDNGTTNVSNLSEAIVSIRFSGNLAVVNTKIGYASAVSVVIDSLRSALILCTVAGENALVVVLDEKASRDEVIKLFQKAFPRYIQ